MHEIGVLLEIVKTVEGFAKKNNVTQIQTLVLQVGELSSMVPKYLQTLYTTATDGTLLEGSELKIEILPANGLCQSCKSVFNLVISQGKCPSCQAGNYDVLGGKEFNIKEIECC